MRAVVQRVREASVVVDGATKGAIGDGLLVYLGVDRADTNEDVDYIADKVSHLRIFPDAEEKMNLDVSQEGGKVLVVSAFTIQADARKGRRPSFEGAAAGDSARVLYEMLCGALTELGLTVTRGVFGATMEVHSVNAGPVCILLDSRRGF
ncbi:MAG: D-aminoacyl-tRNA deacylase [Phycisphaerales bacterium]|nr:D-aminoacyl-tRNA deacylase [Phycisphaerales bacterium]